MIRALTFLPFMAVFSCADETVSGFAENEVIFALTTVDGAAVTYAASLQFPEEGKVLGAGPCNTFSAPQTAPYPWFQLGPVAITRRACLDLASEQDFLDALGRMTIVEVAGPVLILSNDAGQEMVFEAQP